MNVAIITIGYNLPGYTQRLMDSAERNCCNNLTWIVFSHSTMPEKVRELDALTIRSNVKLFDYGFNRGLAKSWNEGILLAQEEGHDVIMVVNEDVIFGDGDVDKLAAAAMAQQDRYIVVGRAFHHDEAVWSRSRFGCFAVNPLAIERLGCFDENFFPIYYEDSDYRRRAALADLEEGYCPTTAIEHEGSASLRQSHVAAQNRLTYAGNRAYYMAKWGGDGGQELFTNPFNDTRFSCFIDPRDRETPYPGHNRIDQQIVCF